MSCPDCFRGQIHEGETKGKVIKHYGFDTYVSEPPNGTTPKGIIVVIPDAFGWAFPNNRILADTYAEKGGFKVYLPDFMNGKLRRRGTPKAHPLRDAARITDTHQATPRLYPCCSACRPH